MIIMIYKTDKDDVMVKMMVMIVIMVILMMLLTAFFEHSAISLPRLSRVVQWGSVQGTNL